MTDENGDEAEAPVLPHTVQLTALRRAKPNETATNEAVFLVQFALDAPTVTGEVQIVVSAEGGEHQAIDTARGILTLALQGWLDAVEGMEASRPPPDATH